MLMTLPWPLFAWLAVCVLLAYTIEAATGFGSIVIALSLAALLLPLAQLIPILVPLNVLMTTVLVWRHRHDIAWALLLRQILPLMLIGTGIGYLLLPWLDPALLKPLFALLLLWFAGREWWRLHHQQQSRRHPSWLMPPLIFSAGISHGLFASGGPLLVYALAGDALGKARFRATLLSVWLTLNGALTVAFLVDGRLRSALPVVLWLVPLLPVGMVLGQQLHVRLDEQRFRQLVYALLVLVGLALLLARPETAVISQP